MPRPQFTLRALLVLVLVVAVVTWAYDAQAKRSARFAAIADDAEKKAEHFRQCSAVLFAAADQGMLPWRHQVGPPRGPRDAADGRLWAKDCLSLAEYYDMLGAKYEQAAKQPWLRVDEDEPAPEWKH
ncbi:MAG TPA: hypothetical protein VHC22_22585 [Pirellulales bacterium]|nr:hypothetical protein [Pirellulales bacterium]